MRLDWTVTEEVKQDKARCDRQAKMGLDRIRLDMMGSQI